MPLIVRAPTPIGNNVRRRAHARDSPNGTPSKPPAAVPQNIDRVRLQQLQTQGAAIVEVLPAEEFDSEHLAGALSLPLERLDAHSAEAILGSDVRRSLVVYCQAPD
jgi:hypothetical protein